MHTSQMESRKGFAVSITEGRTVRDLFCNGFLHHFLDANVPVTVFTQAHRVTDFTNEWRRTGIDIVPLHLCEHTNWRSRAFRIRRKIAGLGSRGLLKVWLSFEEKHFYPPPVAYTRLFREREIGLLLTTHAHFSGEADLISSAHAAGVPTVGLVRSWDNVYKGIKTRPQDLIVWNEINRQEVISLEGYAPDRVHVLGSPQFDRYFRNSGRWSRAKLAAHFELDPERPILLFATLGYFNPGFDETCWMDVLLNGIDRGLISGDPQVICRLHPWSRFEHFRKYANHPDVRLSYVDRYWPALTWYMTGDDVDVVANILRHADAVVSPGSTMVLEAAIFDRPTLIPIFHPYQPEQAGEYFRRRLLKRHFARIHQLDLIPFVDDPDEFYASVNQCVLHPEWYREQRRRLVGDYVSFTDGRATDRTASFCLRMLQSTISHQSSRNRRLRPQGSSEGKRQFASS